jgi:uncharacterized protein (TIGR02677 family)
VRGVTGMGADEAVLGHADRVRLESLRYATVPEQADYIAIMRTFSGAISGLLSDQSAVEVATRLAELGIDLDPDTVDARLSYLVEHGNLARSPREAEARSIREYLQSRARYQLTQRGELVHRQVEELLGSAETAREVSSEMLGGILDGLLSLRRYDDATLAAADPDELARAVGTVFAQFERLVESTRDFYTYLAQVLSRYDLDRGEFQVFKTALLDYLQRFVDEISRHMPQVADALIGVAPRVVALCTRANAGQRLIGVDGQVARRARGLDPADWDSLRAWFVGERGRSSDATEVRHLATDAMRALLVNLRRIAANSELEQSRYTDLLKLARWFDTADDQTGHALWVAAFGLYSARHLAFVADDESDPVPATTSWWQAPAADVPVMLRARGERKLSGRSGRREDFSAARRARLAEHDAAERRRSAALDELAQHRGRLVHAKVSDDAREALLGLYARALSVDGRPLTSTPAITEQGALKLEVWRTPGESTVIISPAGRLELVDISLRVDVSAEFGDEEALA